MSVINTNLNALVSQESSRSSNLKLSRSMERLSTGLRINSAKDDAAGLAITNRMTSQVRGIQMAIKNSNDAISMSQTAEGAYGQVGNILQRMRELAVQSATATMNASDRSSLQLEVDQLVEEINHIADTTNFNNIKLLNGTAKDLVIQTGANQEDKIKMSFDSVRANHIGSDIQPSVTSLGGTVALRGALADGDLMINGVQIGPSFSDNDNLSASSADASAIAKVAAINRKSDDSGVIAKVAANTVSGANSMTGMQTTGNIVINGYTTATITTTTDTSLSRKLVTNAINAISGATGVKAINTDSDTGGVALVADDGRNITLATSLLTTGGTGLANTASTTYVGSFHLYSKDGSDIVIGSAEDKRLNYVATAEGVNKAGLRIGTFDGRSASTVTAVRNTVADAAAVSATAGVLNGDTLVINGIAIGAAVGTDDVFSYQFSSDVSSSSQRSASAIAIAAAINKQSERTGVTAKAQENVLRGTAYAGTNTATTIQLNGINITTLNTGDINSVIDAFNEVSGQTGVVASKYGSALELRAADGRNIAIAASIGAAADLGLTGVGIGTASYVTFYSSVQLESDEAFTVESGYEGTSNFELLGFRRGTFGGAVGDKVSEIDITTQTGANDAIRALDAAINQVSAAQAMSGALNNRLDVIVNNLSEGLQNMSASRSRILDTDYASETTELAKQQIIQQAATAMLAQANQQPQGVLALLR